MASAGPAEESSVPIAWPGEHLRSSGTIRSAKTCCQRFVVFVSLSLFSFQQCWIWTCHIQIRLQSLSGCATPCFTPVSPMAGLTIGQLPRTIGARPRATYESRPRPWTRKHSLSAGYGYAPAKHSDGGSRQSLSPPSCFSVDAAANRKSGRLGFGNFLPFGQRRAARRSEAKDPAQRRGPGTRICKSCSVSCWGDEFIG